MRVLLVQQTIEPPGGGNAVAAWMLQALSEGHELTTLTSRRWQAEPADRFFGTSLAGIPIRQLVPGPLGRAVRRLPGRLDRLRMAVLLRTAQQRAHEFDLLATADNYAAFGRPGLQYLHYPAALRPPPTRWVPLVHAYYAACDRISGLSWDSARFNVTLANSDWTARLLQAQHGIPSRVLYPPVADPGPGLPWSDRTNTFLCVGRFHGSKRFELAVSILARVRAWLSDARLLIVGSNVDTEYARRLRAHARRFADWISIKEDLSQRELFALMGSCRYGLHAMEGEHFGMGVAEMARAGCVVFVHNSGGQVEAVGRMSELLWTTPDEAVARIRTVVQNRALQDELSVRLRAHAERFSTARFVREFREIVDGYRAAIDRNPGSRSNSA